MGSLASLPFDFQGAFLRMCSRGGLLTSRMRNMWSLIFYLGRVQPPLFIVLLFPSRSIGPQGMNSNRLPRGPICLPPQEDPVKWVLRNSWSINMSFASVLYVTSAFWHFSFGLCRAAPGLMAPLDSEVIGPRTFMFHWAPTVIFLDSKLGMNPINSVRLSREFTPPCLWDCLPNTTWAAQASTVIFHTLRQRQWTVQVCDVLMGPAHTALWWWERSGFGELISPPGRVSHSVCAPGTLHENRLSLLGPSIPWASFSSPDQGLLEGRQWLAPPISLVSLPLDPESLAKYLVAFWSRISRWREWGKINTMVRNCLPKYASCLSAVDSAGWSKVTPGVRSDLD